jgi:hypothetical protein
VPVRTTSRLASSWRTTRAQQLRVEPAPDQFAPEAHERGALGRRLGRRKAAEPPEARPVVERLRQPHVRQVVPDPEQQRLEQRQRRPGRLSFRSGMDPGQQRVDRGPIDHRRNLVKPRVPPAASAARKPERFLTDPPTRHAPSAQS